MTEKVFILSLWGAKCYCFGRFVLRWWVRDFTDLEFMAVLPQPPECSGYRFVSLRRKRCLHQPWRAGEGPWSTRRRAGCRRLVCERAGLLCLNRSGRAAGKACTAWFPTEGPVQIVTLRHLRRWCWVLSLHTRVDSALLPSRTSWTLNTQVPHCPLCFRWFFGA